MNEVVQNYISIKIKFRRWHMLKKKMCILISCCLVIVCLVILSNNTEYKKIEKLISSSEKRTKDSLEKLEKSSLDGDDFWKEHEEILNYEIEYIKNNSDKFSSSNLTNEINGYINGLEKRRDSYKYLRNNDTQKFDEEYSNSTKIIECNKEDIFNKK